MGVKQHWSQFILKAPLLGGGGGGEEEITNIIKQKVGLPQVDYKIESQILSEVVRCYLTLVLKFH